MLLKNLESTLDQLQQLAETLNKFKSEAVQLRIVDLLLGEETDEEVEEESPDPAQPKLKRKKKSKTKKIRPKKIRWQVNQSVRPQKEAQQLYPNSSTKDSFRNPNQFPTSANMLRRI